MKKFRQCMKSFGLIAILVSMAAIGLVWAGAVSERPYGVSTPYWYGYTSGAKTGYYIGFPTLTANVAPFVSTLTTNAPDAANSIWGISNKLQFEGATADAYETSVTPADPTADRTITLPDYTGGIPLVIAQGSTQTSVANDTADETGSSLSLADGWFTAGKTLKITIYGTCTGANAIKNVILYIDDAAIVTLATASADVGDWKAEFILHEHTDTANQDAMGVLTMDQEAVYVDYATDTTDFNDGGATTVKCQIVSGNASDTITAEYVLIEHWNK